MDSLPGGISLMAVCVVSGSVALLAFHAHKRLLSDFLNQMEQEVLARPARPAESGRPRAGFEDNMVTMEPTRHEVESHGVQRAEGGRRTGQTMPVNRQVLYRGILQYRSFRGHGHI